MNRKILLLVLLAAACVPGLALADEKLWSLLQGGGQVVLVRHALTDPGVGDPEGMKLSDCKTQRNLSKEGQREAVQLGAELRRRGVPVAALLSSPWCRCLETARLAFARPVEVHAALGNLFDRREGEAAQVEALRELVQQRAPQAGNVFMITHGSTTHALTGVSPGTSEMVVLTPRPGGGFRVAGRLTVSPARPGAAGTPTSPRP
jgi:phosphohistidine phosphatase SixA